MRTFLTTFIMRCLLAAACLITVTATLAHADDRDTTTKVSGVISKIEPGRISVTTSWGHMSIQSDALSEAKVGDEITVWVNENNVVLMLTPKGGEAGAPLDSRQVDLCLIGSECDQALDARRRERFHGEMKSIQVRGLCRRHPDHRATERHG